MEVEWLPRQQQHQEDSDELRQLQGWQQTVKADTRPEKAEPQGGGQTAGTVHLGLRV